LGLCPKPHQRDFFEKKSLWKPQKTEIKKQIGRKWSGSVLYGQSTKSIWGPHPKRLQKESILNQLFQKFLKVFEDCQETFSKKFLDRGLGQRPNSNHNRLHRLAVQPVFIQLHI
jgi:hypothetical protein